MDLNQNEAPERLAQGTTRRRFLAQMAAAGAGLPLARWPLPERTSAWEADVCPICVFSKHLQFLGYDAMAEAAAEIGFDGIDLTVRPGGHVLPENVEEDLPRAVEAVRQAGLDVPMMTTAITDPADPLTEPVLRAASDLGISAYRMGYLSYPDDLGVAESLAAYRPQLRKLAVMNAQYGLHGAYQNHAGTRVGGPVWDLWILLDGLDPQHLGCQYDVRHATVEGGTAWPLGLKLLHPFVKTTVIKDFRWAQREDGTWHVQNVPLGEGMVDFAAYFDLVNAYGIEGPISVHFEYPLPEDDVPEAERRKQTVAAMRQDLETLRAMMAEAGL